MGILGKAIHTLRVWTGFGDSSDLHLTPSHGWLLATPLKMRPQQQDMNARPLPRVPYDKGSRS